MAKPKAQPALEIHQATADPDTRDALRGLVEQRINAKLTVDELTRQIKEELNPAITELLNEIGQRRIVHDGWVVGLKPWSNSHVDKELLLDNGVTMDVIDASTVCKSGFAIEATAPRVKNAKAAAVGSSEEKGGE